MRSLASRWSRRLLLCGLASVALYGGSCSHDHGEGTGGTAGELADVIYEGETNDEALEVLLAATPVTNPPKVAVFDAPTEGAELPASSIPTFSWHVETSGGARAPIPSPRSRWALLDIPDSPRASLGPILDLLGPERAASAHGAPVNGTAHLLVLSTPTNDKLLRVFTTKTTYTPDAAAWAKLTAAGAPIQAWILTGIFDNNAVASDGGPFRGPWIAFTVTP